MSRNRSILNYVDASMCSAKTAEKSRNNFRGYTWVLSGSVSRSRGKEIKMGNFGSKGGLRRLVPVKNTPEPKISPPKPQLPPKPANLETPVKLN